MQSRALILAAVIFVLGGTARAAAQNLEAGKPPSQIFSSTCSLCHKSTRGLVKSVSPGALPGFLRQHYTTSRDMAAAMSAYVLASGGTSAPAAGGNLTRQGQEAKSGGGSAPDTGADPARERKPPAREAARQDADGLQGSAPQGGTRAAEQAAARQKAAAERKAARLAARSKADKEEVPPKNEARHENAKDEPGKEEEAARPSETPKPDSAGVEAARSEPPKPEGTRSDPVPAVTPAPKDGEAKPRDGEGNSDAAAKPADKSADVVVALPKAAVPSGPLTIDIGPPPAPKTAVAGPPVVPAGRPEPPISR